MEGSSLDLGMLLLRIGVASMWFGSHGLPKLLHFSERAGDFPDPLGLGSRATLLLVTVAELIGGVAVVLGLFTRAAAAISVAISIGAEISLPDNQPVRIRGILLYPKETARLYLCTYAAILVAGPGWYSLDRIWLGA